MDRTSDVTSSRTGESNAATTKRLKPTLETIRSLFARSGNRCAFPGCSHPLVDEDDLFVAQICHIEAALPAGQRFNPGQTPEQRRSANNLMIMCYAHHRKTDDVDRYPVGVLTKMKADHERDFGPERYSVPSRPLEEVASEIADYWKGVAEVSRQATDERWFPIEVSEDSTHQQLIADAREALNGLRALLEGLTSQGHDWDLYHIGLPNWLATLELAIAQLSVRLLEEASLRSPEDQELADSLGDARNRLSSLASISQLID